MSSVARVFVLVASAASLVFALAAADARAVITKPLTTDIPLAPPPISALPPAGETSPPAEAISDPIQPDAVCGDWRLQSSYGDRWPAGSTWWEYQCTYTYPQCSGMCNADWGPYVWVHYFYWDGSNAVFYGEFFGDYYYNSMYSASGCSYWWDAPTSQWYLIECPEEEPLNNAPTANVASVCSGLDCTFDGSGSTDNDGTIESYEWVFGDGTSASGAAVQHVYAQSGTYTVTLTVTDDDGAWESEWETVVVTGPNAAPAAAFTLSCSALTCSFDGWGSSDSDGTIVTYEWDFGDGTTGNGATIQHSYAQAGMYTVMLTVTDNRGAGAAVSKPARPISLTAEGYTVKGLKKVDLAWAGSSPTGFAVYRKGVKIATVQANAHTDTLSTTAAGSYVYKVCAVATPVCSNKVTVTF
jgi:chitodextrinase